MAASVTSKERPKNYESLLNLRPKFLPRNKNLPFMDRIKSTKSCSLDMEYNHEENEAENLTERRVLKELQKDDKLRVHEFDMDCGFAIATDDTTKKKKEN